MDTHRIITTLNPKLADVKPFTKVDEYYMEIEPFDVWVSGHKK